MPVKNSLIAIGSFSIFCCLVQGMKPPEPATPARPAKPEVRKVRPTPPPLRFVLSPPTQNSVSHHLKEGTVHVYPLPVKAGERVEVIAFQDNVDLRAALFDPAGKYLFTVDSRTGATGPERILWVAEVSGSYRIDISCNGPAAPGTYRIWITDEGPSTANDEKDGTAERLFYQAAEEKKNRNLDSAEEKLRKAAAIWEEIDKPARQADALSLLGEVSIEKWKWDGALKEFRQARLVYRKLRQVANEGRADDGLGLIHEQLADLVSAQESYQEALACGERSRDRSVIATSCQGLGSVYRKQGKSAEALKILERARAAWEGINPLQESRTLISMGEVFVAGGKWDKAKAKYLESLSVSGLSRQPRAKAFTLLGVGNLYLKIKEPSRARLFYERALRIEQKEGLIDDMSIALAGIANSYLNERRPQDALDPLRKSLKIFETKKDSRSQARVFLSLGWVYTKLLGYKDARKSFELALTLAQEQDLDVSAGALLGLARLEEIRGDPIAARRQAEAAVGYVEKLRAAAGRDFRISFLATEQSVYDTLIEMLFKEHSVHPASQDDAQALRVSEQARSRGLLDSISSSGSSPAPILSLQEIQATILDPDTLLLEYHLGKNASYLWVVGSSFYRVIKLAPRQKLEELAGKVYRLMKSAKRRKEVLEASGPAMELSRALLGPAVHLLGRKRLLISSPDALQSVPIRSLPDPGVKEVPTGESAWPQPLFVDHEVVSIPSASVLGALRTRANHRLAPTNRLAFVGDAVTSEKDPRLAGVLGASPSKRLSKTDEGFEHLLYAQAEGEAILKEAGRRHVLGASGFEATRQLVISGQLSNYRNLHFATHSHLRPDDASRSALVLSMWDSNGQPINGFLEAADIYDLDLPADLVVLSACETGLGEDIPGEGLVGLPQAFLGAGATRVMVSLWSIDDLATSKLMGSFYHEYFTNGLSPTEALRKAQIGMWKARVLNAPFYWGGFELLGDWQWDRDPR
jgi:CHAT domain-containing protein/Tfp pilus assembly protein PilF